MVFWLFSGSCKEKCSDLKFLLLHQLQLIWFLSCPCFKIVHRLLYRIELSLFFNFFVKQNLSVNLKTFRTIALLQIFGLLLLCGFGNNTSSDQTSCRQIWTTYRTYWKYFKKAVNHFLLIKTKTVYKFERKTLLLDNFGSEEFWKKIWKLQSK